MAPVAAVRLSPIEAMTSMSPGRSWCTEVGGVGERAPGPLAQGNGKLRGTTTCFSSCETKNDRIMVVFDELRSKKIEENYTIISRNSKCGSPSHINNFKPGI
jgi:hypothetical protein